MQNGSIGKEILNYTSHHIMFRNNIYKRLQLEHLIRSLLIILVKVIQNTGIHLATLLAKKISTSNNEQIIFVC